MVKRSKHAGFRIRFISWILDAIFVGVFSLVNPIGGLLAYGINIYLVGTQGFSIGKKIMHLRIIKENGKHLDLIDALIREVVGKFISGVILGIGYLLIIFDSEKQGLHDKIAKTYVVYDK